MKLYKSPNYKKSDVAEIYIGYRISFEPVPHHITNVDYNGRVAVLVIYEVNDKKRTIGEYFFMNENPDYITSEHIQRAKKYIGMAFNQVKVM
ncbi:hypothetical protein MM5_176 [Morganella phage vB_Mm5]